MHPLSSKFAAQPKILPSTFMYIWIRPTPQNPDSPLFGEGLGLDSIDALELIVLLEKYYGIKIQDPKDGKVIFQSLRTMAEYITAQGKS